MPDAMPFRLRLRHCDRISSRSGKQRQSGERVFANLPVSEPRRLSGKRWVWGRRVYIVATRLPDGELLRLATAHQPRNLSGLSLAVGDRDPLCGLENAGFQSRIAPFLPRRTAQPVGRAVGFGFLLGDAHFSTTAG